MVIFMEKSRVLMIATDQSFPATLNQNCEAINEYTEIGRMIKDPMKNYDPEKSIEWKGIKVRIARQSN
jgi:ABC-type polysaccharide/polyol phosphate transport system ATPase subunit